MNAKESKPKKSKKTNPSCKSCGEPLALPHEAGRSPFCSERCRLQDLSKWFGENYRIASHPVQSHTSDDDEAQTD